ncbi:MAG TPA: hypothetical protein VJL59_07620 [Anaerolineales bacterium]|nr:hypothetical protein [Anaerolineales bacterium]
MQNFAFHIHHSAFRIHHSPVNWSLLLGLTVALCIIAFFRLRTEKRRVQVTNWLVVYPGAVVILLYAWFFAKWLEVGIALAATAVIVGVWWVAYGSYLPPPTSDNISVWGQEAKKPTQVAAEAQEEVERLKKEKEELEKELKELKAKRNGKG